MKRTSIDARNLRCPLPLLKLKQGLAGVEIGNEIELTATDAGSWRDIPAFVALTQHNILEAVAEGDTFRFVVLKGE